MPSTIPFDPSLVLGNLIQKSKIDQLKKIAKEQEPADDAQDELNHLILIKRKMDMTYQEMVNMGVSVPDLQAFEKEIEDIKKQLSAAAANYGKAASTSAKSVAKTKDSDPQSTIGEEPESPIDWNKSAIKKMPISSDSMNTDIQFIRNEKEVDGNEAHASNIAGAVSASVGSIFGSAWSGKMAHSAASTSLHQTMNHDIVATLVITTTCTHKIADVFAPFIMDPDKAVDAWNALNEDKLDVSSEDSMKKALTETSSSLLHLLSGQTMGSSFVGMVHFVNSETSDSTQTESARTSAVDIEAKYSGLLTYYSGKFGLTSESSDKLQNLLSTNTLNSHCSVITMGLIPTLKSTTVETSVKTLQPKATDVMNDLSKIQGATDGEVTSADDKAKAARTGQNFISLKNSYIGSAVSALGQTQAKENSVINTNSLMTAHDDFVKKAAADDACGVPINFFIKDISKKEIAKAYLKKYSPLPNWQLSSDDDSGDSPSS
jgi:hypothetical protein